MEMYSNALKEAEQEMGQGPVQRKASSSSPNRIVRGYWDGREPLEDESELALAQQKQNERELLNAQLGGSSADKK